MMPSPRPPQPVRVVSTKNLLEEEKKELVELGFDVAANEQVVTDIRARMERDSVDANTANTMALAELEEEDRLATVNPDIAEDIRNSMRESVFGKRPDMADTMDMIDEDAGDAPEAQPEQPKKSTEKSAEELDEKDSLAIQLRNAARRHDERLDAIRKSITDEEREAVLLEAIRGVPYTKTFVCWGGRVSITLQTISTPMRLAIQNAVTMHARSRQDFTVSEYNNHRKYLDMACSVSTITISDQVAYTRVEGQLNPEQIASDVMLTGPGRAEIVRTLISAAFDEMALRLSAMLQEASKDVFIDPVFDDAG